MPASPSTHPVTAPHSLAAFLASPAGETLRGHFHSRCLDDGVHLDSRQDADHILVVSRGRLRVYLSTPERELSLIYLEAGDVFSTHTRAQLHAVGQSMVMLAPRKAIERELAHWPALQVAVIRVLAQTLNRSITLIEDLAFHTVRGRIARFILRCAARHKAEIVSGSSISLGLSMEEIATLLGTTRQTASTIMNEMIHSGVLTRCGRRLVIIAPDILSTWAGENV